MRLAAGRCPAVEVTSQRSVAARLPIAPSPPASLPRTRAGCRRHLSHSEHPRHDSRCAPGCPLTLRGGRGWRPVRRRSGTVASRTPRPAVSRFLARVTACRSTAPLGCALSGKTNRVSLSALATVHVSAAGDVNGSLCVFRRCAATAMPLTEGIPSSSLPNRHHQWPPKRACAIALGFGRYTHHRMQQAAPAQTRRGPPR